MKVIMPNPKPASEKSLYVKDASVRKGIIVSLGNAFTHVGIVVKEANIKGADFYAVFTSGAHSPRRYDSLEDLHKELCIDGEYTMYQL